MMHLRSEDLSREIKLAGCTASCYNALHEKCVCRCGGTFHGKGRKYPDPEDEYLDHKLSLQIWKMARITSCLCGIDLKNKTFQYYEHGAGWRVEGIQGKIWIYVHCPICNYDTALWKLGIHRQEAFSLNEEGFPL